MEYILNSNVSKEYLKKANGIRVSYKDRYKILDMIEECPDAYFLLTINFNINEDLNAQNFITKYSKMLNDRFILLIMPENYEYCVNNNINYAFNITINSFNEFNALLNYTKLPTHIFITSPLSNSLSVVNELMIKANRKGQIKITVFPNAANLGLINCANTICGNWIRPEDLNQYCEKTIDAIGFINEDESAAMEQVLYRIYAEYKKWDGSMKLVVKDLNQDFNNTLVASPGFSAKLNCGQKCMTGHNCRLCKRIADLAQDKTYAKIVANK